MADQPTITNSDLGELLISAGVFSKRGVTVAAGEVLAKNTVLAIADAGYSTAGSLTTIPLTANLAALIAIDAGEFTLKVDGGSPANITAIDLRTATTIAQVAALIDTAISAAGATATVKNGDQIVITSDTPGATSAIAITAYSAGAGDDLTTAALLATAGATVVAGAVVPAQAVTVCASTAIDGSDRPRMILMQALDNSAGNAAATFTNVQVLMCGEFRDSKIVFDNGTDTLDTITKSNISMRDALKSEGLYAVSMTELNILDNQ